MTQVVWPISHRRFYTPDEITDYEPRSDEDAAVKRILTVAKSKAPYIERMAALEEAIRLELRAAFSEAFSQIGAELS